MSAFLLILVVVTLINRTFLEQLKIIRLDKNIDTLVIGDSHTKCAIDPALVAHSVNSSLEGESFFSSYYKLKAVLEQNKSIKNVVLGCSYHNICTKHEYNGLSYFVLIDNKNIMEIAYPIVMHNQSGVMAPTIDLALYYLKYKVGLPLYMQDEIQLRRASVKTELEKLPYWGGYRYSDGTALSALNTTQKVELHFYRSNNLYAGTSQLLIGYLEKIAAICRDKHIRLFLVATPLHESYLAKVPEIALSDFNATVNSVVERYDNVHYLDMTQLKLDERCYGDSHHVNSYGALPVSRYLNVVLRDATSTKVYKVVENVF